MPEILTSWKEIAKYVGKGVRTVQRWERNLGFPVRRPRQRKGPVVALADEIDSWLQSCFTDQLSELEKLRQEVSRLSAENQVLRQRLSSFRKANMEASTPSEKR